MKLFKHQIDNARRLANAIMDEKFAMDASQTGTGKSLTALQVAKELGRPVFIIAPKSTHAQWISVAKAFFKSAFDDMFTGVVNAEALRSKACGEITETDRYTKQVIWRINSPIKSSLLVWDEFHKGCSGRTSGLTQLFIDASRRSGGLLAMSATPAMTPLQSRAISVASGICQSNPKAFETFALKHGCVKATWFPGRPLQFNGGMQKASENMAQIRAEMTSAGAVVTRTLSSQVKDFPETEIISYPCEILQSQDSKELFNAVSGSISRANSLSARIKMRVLVESAKAPAISDFTEELASQGYSVVIFCAFHETIGQLAASFIRKKIAYHTITGETAQGARGEILESFAKDERRVLLLQISAGGTGLSLHKTSEAQRDRVSIVNPCENSADFIQAFGRVQRAGGNFTRQFIPVVPDSEEEKIMSLYKAKKAGLEALCGQQPQEQKQEKK
jgi:Superfamily II DNA/RNA helicases, SNF2 family